MSILNKNAIGEGLQDDERVCTCGDKEEKHVGERREREKENSLVLSSHVHAKTGQEGKEANKERKKTKVEEFFSMTEDTTYPLEVLPIEKSPPAAR